MHPNKSFVVVPLNKQRKVTQEYLSESNGNSFYSPFQSMLLIFACLSVWPLRIGMECSLRLSPGVIHKLYLHVVTVK